MLIQRDNTTLLVVDIQEKLLPAVLDPQGLVSRVGWLLQALGRSWPAGGAVRAIPLRAGPRRSRRWPNYCPDAPVVEKKHFSCVAAQCLPDSLMARRQVVLVGMEAHVCVLQTALELKAAGKEVFVVTDGISNRAQHDLDAARPRLPADGVWLVNREMVLFELLRSSG